MTALRVLLALLLLQDRAPIEQLILDLDHDDIVRRETAMMKLCDLGRDALPALEKALEQPVAERRLRARDALERIERQIRIRAAFTDPPIVDLRCQDQPMEDVLLKLGPLSGLSITLKAELGKKRITLTRQAMTPMEALDAICLQAGNCDWSYTSPRVVEIREGTPLTMPASYESRFRFTLPHIETFRSRHGDRTTGTLCICIQADHERGVAPIVPPEIVIDRVVDETGRDLLPSAEAPIRVNSLFRDDEMLGDPELSFHSRPILLPGQQAAARRLSRIAGHAIYHFALQESTIDIPEVDSGTWVRAGELEIGVFGLRAGALQIRIQADQGHQVPRGILNVTGVRIVDDEGTEHQVPLHQVEMRDLSTGGVSSIHYLLLFDSLGQRSAKKAQLKLVTDAYEKKVSFEFTDVPLP